MANQNATILIVEDSPSLARTYAAQLEQCGYQTLLADTGAKARAMIKDANCVLLDLGLPDEDGLDILTDWKQIECPVIVVTANGSINTAVDAMQCGAIDFLVKPFQSERLITTVANALEKSRLTRIVKTYEKSIDRRSFGGFIGDSLEMQAVYRTLESAAKSKASVFILGESGVGKELAARAIHDYSPRADRPFVAINCGAIPHNLLESELFGHIKGAFTGATSDRLGAASQANGGTLFLDEITEMDVALQPKLLRFLQLGSFQKVGSDKVIETDIRVVAASNRNPIESIAKGVLREDLYYRLNVLPIELPPLRERRSDIEKIADSFIGQYSKEEGKSFTGFTKPAITALTQYDWPGNVRELQNIIRQIVVLNEGTIVDPSMILSLLLDQKTSSTIILPNSDTANTTSNASPLTDNGIFYPKPLWQLELEIIDKTIEYCDGNIQKASRLLDINPSTIYRKRERARSKISDVA